MHTRNCLPTIFAILLLFVSSAGCTPPGAPQPLTTPAPPAGIPTIAPEPTSPLTSALTPTPQPAAPTAGPAVPATAAEAIPTPESLVESLAAYAVSIRDILEAGRAALQRQAPLLVAAGIIPRAALDELALDAPPLAPDPGAACGGPQTAHPMLVADAARMQELHAQLSAITPPQQAANWVHRPLLNTLAQWGDALDKINAGCETADAAERLQLHTAGGLALREAYANFVVAGVAAQQIFVWSGLIEAAEAVAGEDNGVSAQAVCAEPAIYRPDAQLAGADLASADLSHCVLTNANLSGADLSSANLDHANLAGADLRGAILINAILDGANLTGARLNGADLRNAILNQATLTGADLSDADLRNAILQGALLDQIIWRNTICPDNSNSDTNGLDACLPE